eukprot:scaffold15.g4205.t1
MLSVLLVVSLAVASARKLEAASAPAPALWKGPVAAPAQAPAAAVAKAPAASGALIVIDWKLGTTYDDQVASVGQTVAFNWSAGKHGVFRVDNEECPLSFVSNPAANAVEVAEHYFACQVPGHCNMGMLIKFTVQ